MRTVTIVSSLDGREQNALFFVPPGAEPGQEGDPVPLLVFLHTWSAGYAQCQEQRFPASWAVIAPHFRGPNVRPEACASPAAIRDVLDAVAYAKLNARIDETRIYLAGWSGGGHMALMLAAKAPRVWAGVSAWVPVSDLAAWRVHCASNSYARNLDAVCGGPLGTLATDEEYKARSPLHCLAAARGVPIDINAGIHDGHTGSVPISQSLRAFNVLANANGCQGKLLSEADIQFMTREAAVPPALAGETETDPERKRGVLFRRVAGAARITLFEGGHEAEADAAWGWLGRQKQGAPADFQPASPAGSGAASNAVQPVAR